MAVAVKTNTDARPSVPPFSPAILSLLGVVYLILSLVVLFKIVPDMWWTVWNNLSLGGMQLARFPVVGAALLLVLSLFLAFSLIGLGNRLLGPQPPVGVRAGIFVVFVSLLLCLLLTRWISIGLERLAGSGAMSPLVGAILTAVLGVGLTALIIQGFFQKWAQKNLVVLEEMGWFSTQSYKLNQGQRVRRATIFGILLLVGSGIYSMLHHNTLRRAGNDWLINIPFTGTIAIEGIGDAQALIKDKVPLSAKTSVQIRYPGAKELRLSTGQLMSIDSFKAKFNHALKEVHFSEATITDFANTADLDPIDYMMKVNNFIYAEIESLLDSKNDKGEPLLKADVIRRMRVLDNETEMADLNRLIEAVRREVIIARNRPGADEDTAFLNLPAAVLLVDRFSMKEVYDATAKERTTRVELPGNSKFKAGQVVSREEFDAEVTRLSSEESKALGLVIPESKDLKQPYGSLVYSTLTLLPSIQYTVPLLLILGSIWFAWRVVNVPAFADFLIATEGEMNKVSWSTQKKLIQDTIVVLSTVFLMSVFLFVVDYGWKLILQPLGVLHIPKVSQEQQKQIEQKKW